MADRTSAALFARMFEKLASDPTPQHVQWAKDLWVYTSNYDFNSYQMCCDDALLDLNLARKKVDPENPEYGEVMFYGPPDNDSR